MEGEDGPSVTFRGGRRRGKSTRRKRERQRVSATKEADSSDDGEKNRVDIVSRRVWRGSRDTSGNSNSLPTNNISQVLSGHASDDSDIKPKEVPTVFESTVDDDGKVEVDPSAVLRSVVASQAKSTKQSIFPGSENDSSSAESNVEAPSDFEVPSRIETAAEDGFWNLSSKMERVMASRASDGKSDGATCSKLFTGHSLGSQSREPTTTSDANVGQDVNHVPYESDDSDGLEWERELLRRSGHGTTELDGMMRKSDLLQVRALADEEDGNRAVRGESGVSLVETCLENMRERMKVSRRKSSALAIELDSCRAAEVTCSEEIEASRTDTRKARMANVFYSNLDEYCRTVSDMLLQTAHRTGHLNNVRLERFQHKSERRALGALRERTPFVESKSVVISAGSTSSPDRSACAINSKDEDNCDPLEDVEDDFKLVGKVVRRFEEWKVQFPSDYGAAHGDLCLGNLCGAIALASGHSCKRPWFESLSGNASRAAVLKSRCSEMAALDLAASWEPLSARSTEVKGTNMRRILEQIVSLPTEFSSVYALILDAAHIVLKWKLRQVRHVQAVQTQKDWNGLMWAARVAVKVVRSTAHLLLEVGLHPRAPVFFVLEDAVEKDWIKGIISSYLEVCVDSKVEGGYREAFDFLVWASSSGLRSYVDMEGSEFLGAGGTVWMELRKYGKLCCKELDLPEASVPF